MEKILVAEDSLALANLLEYLLSAAGFEVSLHRTGTSAFEVAATQEFDLILLDQQMPEMTGIEVLKSIRAGGPNMHKPVFLCTAKTHELDLQQLLDTQQVTGIFHKPFSPKDLVEQLRAVSSSADCL